MLLGALLAAGWACGRTDTVPVDLAAAVEQSREHQEAAGDAVEREDHAAYLTEVREAVRLRPHHPTLVYHLARAYAVNDSGPEALATLDRLARMGIAARPAQDSGFAGLWGATEFEALLARFDGNAAPTGTGRVAFALDEPSFLPEGLAHDPRAGSWFVSSVHRQQVVRVDAGVPRAVEAGALWSVMGLAVDTARKLLWAATTAVPEGATTDSADLGRAAVVALDLASGAPRARYPVPEDGREHWFGDLIVAPTGDVFVSDSHAPGVYRLRPAAQQLEELALNRRVLSPQGLVLSADGRTLYLADYALGVLAIDLETGTTAAVPYPDDDTLLGIDGLYRYAGDLIGIQNGVVPNRVVRMSLNRNGREITRVEVLEAAHPAFADPTLGVVRGDTLFFVANSQWSLFADGADGSDAEPPVVLQLELVP